MSFSPYVPQYVELIVPNAETEQEFLLLAVDAAVKQYRAAHQQHSIPPPTIFDGAGSMQVVSLHDSEAVSLRVR